MLSHKLATKVLLTTSSISSPLISMRFSDNKDSLNYTGIGKTEKKGVDSK